MRGTRLWPLIAALVLLLTSAVVVGQLAHRSEGRLLRFRIAADGAGAAQGDDAEGGDVQGEVWYGSEAVSEAHRSARTFARRGDYPEAFKAFEETLAQAADRGLLWAEYGHWLRRGREQARALAALTTARELMPDSPTVQLDLALLAVAAKDYHTAEEYFSAALSLRPNHMPTRVAYGRYLRRRGAFERAVAVLEPATQAGGNVQRAQALAALGQVHAEAGRGEEALEAFSGAVERAPAVASLWSRAAGALTKMQDPDVVAQGLVYAQKGARLAPTSAYTHKVLGQAYARSGLDNDALAAFRRAVALDGSNTYSRKRVLRLALTREDFSLATRQADALLALDAGRAEFRFLAGLVASKSGDLGAARTHYQQAIERATSPYADAWFNLGLLERKSGDAEAALHAYGQAIEIRPGYVAAINNIGLVHGDLGDLGRAEASFRRAIELDENYTSARVNLARVLAKRKRYDEAADAFAVVVARGDATRSVKLELAVNLRRASHPRRAVAVYEALLGEQPRYVKAWYNLAIAHDALGEVEASRRAYLQALEHDPNHWRSLKNLALLELRQGRLREAGPLLVEALERKPGDAETRLAWAEVSFQRGELRACAKAAKRVLRVTPDDESALLWVQKCTI